MDEGAEGDAVRPRGGEVLDLDALIEQEQTLFKDRRHWQNHQIKYNSKKCLNTTTKTKPWMDPTPKRNMTFESQSGQRAPDPTQKKIKGGRTGKQEIKKLIIKLLPPQQQQQQQQQLSQF